MFFFFSSRRRHTRYWRDWSSDVCSSDLILANLSDSFYCNPEYDKLYEQQKVTIDPAKRAEIVKQMQRLLYVDADRKSTRLNSSHANISYAVFCLKKKNNTDVHHLLFPRFG